MSLSGGSGERLVVVRKRRLSRLSFPRGGRRGESERQICRGSWGDLEEVVTGRKQDSLGATTSLGSSRKMDESPWLEGDESGEGGAVWL